MATTKSEKVKLVISVSGGGALGIGPLQFMRRLEADLEVSGMWDNHYNKVKKDLLAFLKGIG